MKKYLSALLFLIFFSDAFASHIVGGEVFYTYLGAGNTANSSRYRVTLRLFTECDQACGDGTVVACPPGAPIIGIFNNTSPYSLVQNLTLTRVGAQGQPRINLTTYPPCIDVKPRVCYVVNTYSADVTLTNTAAGYIFSYQNCCRQPTLNLVDNVPNPNGGPNRPPGAAYEAILPGTLKLPAGTNSNAVVAIRDTALVCHGNPFKLSFGAVDPDGDSLSYRFAPAYNGGSFTGNVDTQGPDVPPYGAVVYQDTYSGDFPLGTPSIDPVTGLISGIAPAVSGPYVINVLITEWRNGVAIATHRKDFILEVEDCNIPSATLKPQDETCDGFTRHFANQSNRNVTSWFWDFGVPGIDSDTSVAANPTFTYQDTGRYTVKLVVNRGTPCADSSTYNIWVYPGFFPGLTEVAPLCKNMPVQFRDLTRTNYGQVLGWRWDFGTNATNDTSHLQNPVFTYPAAGQYTIHLDVSNSYGCKGSFEKTITINDQPALKLFPKDTSYCALDSVQLSATGNGTFSWSPNTYIMFPNTAGPTVFPPAPTKYYATITDNNGCKTTDSVRVNPVNDLTNSITASATNICAEDTITLTGNSNKTSNLAWQWSPTASVASPTDKVTKAYPMGNVNYLLTTTWGKHCKTTTTKSITVKALAVPDAGPGGYICKGQNSLQLQASGGVSYQWTPTAGLNNPGISNPLASPGVTTMYKVAVGVAGCTKTKTDSVLVEVKALPEANLVDDTLICSIDTLKLITNTAYTYTWSPNYMISSLTAKNPLVSPDVPTTYYTTLQDAFGCINKDSVFVDVKLFVTIDAGPDTTICRTDTMHMHTVSDALSYQWSPASFLDQTNVKYPITSSTLPSIKYYVIGNIGKCQSRDSVTIFTVPYPVPTVSPDTSICFGDNAFLYAGGGVSYSWTPVTYLGTPNSSGTSVIKPPAGRNTFTVTVRDNKGCPKPVTATTHVTVRNPVVPNTGVNDTSIVFGQPLQMNASGGDTYSWSPTQWLSDPTSPTTFAAPENNITYTVTVALMPENCRATDTVNIKVYYLDPSFYVPTAFSPNGDGLNETLKPIALGIKTLRYFKVYNRLGNLVFETTRIGEGWDGYYKGSPQDPGNYVWMAQGETWKGEFITRKGNAVLIR